MSPPPPFVEVGSKIPLAADVARPRPGDKGVFHVTAGTALVEDVAGSVSGGVMSGVWTVSPGTSPVPLAVVITAELRGEKTAIGPTTIVSTSRFSTLGWLTDTGAALRVDGTDGMRVAGGGEKLRLKFDVDDGKGGALAETIHFTFILEREGAPGKFTEVGRGEDEATGVTKFERGFDTPDDSSVPGVFRIVVEARRKGETGPPSIGTRTSPPLRIEIVRPVVTSFVGAETSTGSGEVHGLVGLGPGQTARVFWEVLGAFEDVEITGGAPGAAGKRNVTKITTTSNGDVLAGADTIDPKDFPPDATGHYTIVATHRGVKSEPRQLGMAAITELRVRLAATQTDATHAPHTLVDAKKKPGPVDGVPGKLEALGKKVLGEVTPFSDVIFSWRVVGGALVKIHFGAAHPKTPTNVTKATRDGGGAHEIPLHDDSTHRAVLDAELLLVGDIENKSDVIVARSVIRLREGWPMPKLDSFFAVADGAPVGEGGNVASWDKLGFNWTISGSTTHNRLEVTFQDATHSFLEIFKPAHESDGNKHAKTTDKHKDDTRPTDGGPLKGLVTVTAELRNEPPLNEVQGKIVLHVNVAPPKPGPTPIPPPGAFLPPKMKVGFNYPWSFNHTGYDIGPIYFDLKNPDQHWKSTLPKNLKELRDDLGVRVVRWFLLANGFNYGTITKEVKSGVVDVLPPEVIWHFDPPPALDPKHTAHFEAMLQIFKQEEMQLIPSLLSFEFFAQGEDNGARGRSEVASDPTKRDHFYKTVLDPLLAVAAGFKEQIFAFEVINEPSWNTRLISPPLGRFGSGRDVSEADMTSFLAGAVSHVDKVPGITSTVGHRFIEDLATFPTGKLRQFHYYSRVHDYLGMRLADPELIPGFATTSAFCGELDASPTGPDKANPRGETWHECAGVDLDPKFCVGSRLTVLARKKYELAMLWPDGPEEAGSDALKLTAASKASLKKFTKGLYEDGIP